MCLYLVRCCGLLSRHLIYAFSMSICLYTYTMQYRGSSFLRGNLWKSWGRRGCLTCMHCFPWMSHTDFDWGKCHFFVVFTLSHLTFLATSLYTFKKGIVGVTICYFVSLNTMVLYLILSVHFIFFIMLNIGLNTTRL